MESNLSLFYGLSFLTAAIAFLFALYLYLWVKKVKVQNKRIEEVSKLIKEGADTFISTGYLPLSAVLCPSSFSCSCLLLYGQEM